MGITKRNRATIAAVTRTLVPPAGVVPQGADDLGLVDTVIAEVEGYPPRAQRRFRWLFFATEYFPLISGYRRRFRNLSAEKQHGFLEEAGRHPKSPLRRLVVSFLKQLVYSAYISEPAVEDVVAYRYECLRPREGIEAKGQVHH